MADRTNNIYTELFESIPIPSRLEPENIAIMLSERAGAKSVRAESVPVKNTKTEAVKASEPAAEERRIEVTSGGKRRASALYRSVAAMAACAALALGIIGYMGVGEAELPAEEGSEGGAYASDYNDVHKTFEQYYVDAGGKKTLDSAIKDIEHSYNENENDTQTSQPSDPTVTEAPETEEPLVSGDAEAPVLPEEPEPQPPAPVETTPAPVPNETVDDTVPMPSSDAVYDSSDIIFGDGFILRRDSNTVRVFATSAGSVDYTGNIFPIYEDLTTKTLAGVYADGGKVVAVYSVTRGGAPYASDPVNGLIDGLYGQQSEPRSSVEVCVYRVVGGTATLESVTAQSGSLVDMNYANGSLYLVTAYNDYRIAPIIGVDDLESYVPSYTVNGIKYFVEASDIMIPDYISTTDYTVISGISLDGRVSMKAVLGYEGRVILRSGAVYLFGYDSSLSGDRTSVRVFSLSGGNVSYAGCVYIDGVALGGDGISCFGSAIAVTAVKRVENSYETDIMVYDGTMNLISRNVVPEALTTAERIGTSLYLSGAQRRYGIDLSDPANPVEIKEAPKEDPADGLVEFDGGYVTLTKAADGSLQLAKIIKNAAGELRLEYKTTVCAEKSSASKAVDNNGIMFISGNVVGLPYSYYDGYDYCIRYALYHAAGGAFSPMGEIEFHETDDVYEFGKAVLNGGVLYIFSEGRVSAAVVGDSLMLVDSADIVESAYSGHGR